MMVTRTTLALLLLTACALTMAGCESTGSSKKSSKRTIDRQGLQAVAILGGYLFPRGWNEDTQVSVARRMFPLEYHGNAYAGKTLIQSKVEFDGGALRRLLTDLQRTNNTFTTDASVGDPFGKESHHTLDEQGEKRQLKWWKPGKHKNAAYYFWGTKYPDEPETRIWLQVTDEKRNVKLVYVRIESE